MAKGPKAEKAAPAETPVTAATENDQPVAAGPEAAGEAATTEPVMAAPLAETADPSEEPKAAPAHGVGGGGGQGEKGWATVVSPISHDGADYSIGMAVPVTEAEFRILVKAGAVQDEDWDELPIPF